MERHDGGKIKPPEQVVALDERHYGESLSTRPVLPHVDDDAEIEVPVIEAASRFAAEGVVTGASARNWAAYGTDVAWAPGGPEWQRHLLTDPQTSGGLLVSCSPDALEGVLSTFNQAGFAAAAAIGGMQARAPGQGSQLVCR